MILPAVLHISRNILEAAHICVKAAKSPLPVTWADSMKTILFTSEVSGRFTDVSYQTKTKYEKYLFGHLAYVYWKAYKRIFNIPSYRIKKYFTMERRLKTIYISDGYEFPESAHGAGIRNHPEYKFVFNLLSIVKYFYTVGGNIENPFCSFQYICKMSEDIFHTLLRLVGYICKQAESCNVNKIVFIESAHVTGKGDSVYRGIRRLKNIPGDMQTAGKIISRSCRNVSDRNFLLSCLHSRYNFVQRSIAAAAYVPRSYHEINWRILLLEQFIIKRI